MEDPLEPVDAVAPEDPLALDVDELASAFAAGALSVFDAAPLSDFESPFFGEDE